MAYHGQRTVRNRCAMHVELAGWAVADDCSDVRMGRLNGQNAKTELKEALNLPKHTANLSLPDHISREPVTRFTSLCHATCLGLLRAFAAFDEPSGDTLRLLDYPPLPPGADINDWTRAGGHSDFGSLTLLFTQPGDQGGLELLMRGRDGQEEFVQVPTIPGHVIVNTGDVMEFWTAGLFRSTVHRVTIPSKEAAESHRYSIAYFCHPEDSARLDPIPSLFVSDSSSDSYGSSSPSRTASALFEDAAIAKVGGVRPRTAREHLLLRLQRIHA
ncbi:hypothetical protein BC831DRAFT_484433 [Entophlyctis helioformis]|nr:hypothetical protein BC831DRAFT_484433 [Entophlyctis helioformis]